MKTNVHIFFLIGYLLLVHYNAVFAQKDSQDAFAVLDRAMAAQVSAWDQGDWDTFMKSYWKSEDLKFIGKSGVTYGWEATLARYKKNYPDQKARGKLTFEIISKEKLDKKHIFMIGKWHLKREDGDLQGHFSLIWKKIKGEWKIIADHSS